MYDSNVFQSIRLHPPAVLPIVDVEYACGVGSMQAEDGAMGSVNSPVRSVSRFLTTRRDHYKKVSSYYRFLRDSYHW